MGHTVVPGSGGSKMSGIMPVAVTLALLGSAVTGGVFFAFSSFVMKALARLPVSEGIAAMQSINIVVLNPSFLGTFMGTAVVSAGIAAFTLAEWSQQTGLLLLGGSIAYCAGSFLVTILCNVPLNKQLAAARPSEPTSQTLWEHYLDRWTAWNHVRTAAAIIAALLYSLGLFSAGGV